MHLGPLNICPIAEADLPDVATFLTNRLLRDGGDTPGEVPIDMTADATLQHLRWRLLANPARAAQMDFGQCVRDDSGRVVGTVLAFPERFWLRDKRLLGLCFVDFFVDIEARGVGFFMFRRYLQASGADFLFSTTCNRNSGAFWEKLGGSPIPESACEFILPVRFGPVCEAFAVWRKWPELVVKLAKAAGVVATPFLAPKSTGTVLRMQACRDWDRLAALAQRHRNPDVMTCERSREYLQWRYDQTASSTRKEVFHCQDKHGNEGWFAVGQGYRGKRRQIMAWTLLDLVWPRTGCDLMSVLSGVLDICAPRADIIVIPGRAALGCDLATLGLRQRRFEGPRSYIIRHQNTHESSRILADITDLVASDGDTAD